MYNRYIPQPDGSYRRSRVAEPQRSAPSQPSRQPAPPPPPPPKKEEQKSCPRQARQSPPPKEPPCKQSGSISGFLKQLLPKDFDTGDLLVVILLLLMAADCDDQNTALLTLALYFFM